MCAFWKRWLRRPTDRPSWRPVRESPAAARHYQHWLAAETYRNWTGPWFRAYHYVRGGLPPAWPVQPLTTDCGAEGVALLYDERIGGANFHFLFRLLRDRVVAQDYRVAQADERCWHGMAHDETQQKVVLLPLPGDCPTTACCDQRFGQVTLDLVSRGRQPVYIRLLAQPVPDAGGFFTAPRSFTELLAAVLGVDDAPPTT